MTHSIQNSGREPWLAAALSLLATGVGHVYCGRIATGLVLFCTWLLLPPVVIAAALMDPATIVLVGLILAPAAAMALIYVWAVFDAYRLARKSRSDYALQDFNRPLVYSLLVLVGLIYPLGVVAGVRAYVYEAFLIPSGSMRPSLLDGDRILVNKLRRDVGFPQRGDVVVFKTPQQAGSMWVKRVIGLAGDTIEFVDGRVLVNGSPLPRETVPRDSVRALGAQIDGQVFFETIGGRRHLVMHAADNEKAADGDEEKPAEQEKHDRIVVPDGQVYLLGDSRDSSFDSRSFGAVPVGDIIGQVDYIFCPAATWSRFGVFASR